MDNNSWIGVVYCLCMPESVISMISPDLQNDSEIVSESSTYIISFLYNNFNIINTTSDELKSIS